MGGVASRDDRRSGDLMGDGYHGVWSVRPLHLPGWVILYPCGRSYRPETAEWLELRHQVEAVALAALVGADIPF
jgi:hypothetical protein